VNIVVKMGVSLCSVSQYNEYMQLAINKTLEWDK